MKKMTNENSIKIYEQFISDEEYSIIMELCDCDLKKILDDKLFGFEVNDIKKLLKQLNNAFRVMVKNKIIHRDIKLENVFIKYVDKEKSD